MATTRTSDAPGRKTCRVRFRVVVSARLFPTFSPFFFVFFFRRADRSIGATPRRKLFRPPDFFLCRAEFAAENGPRRIRGDIKPRKRARARARDEVCGCRGRAAGRRAGGAAAAGARASSATRVARHGGKLVCTCPPPRLFACVRATGPPAPVRRHLDPRCTSASGLSSTVGIDEREAARQPRDAIRSARQLSGHGALASMRSCARHYEHHQLAGTVFVSVSALSPQRSCW